MSTVKYPDYFGNDRKNNPVMNMEKWEYKIIISGMHTPEMNELGKDGWENYSITFDKYGVVERMYWKRPLKEPVP